MQAQKFGMISLMILKVIFGVWDVFYTSAVH